MLFIDTEPILLYQVNRELARSVNKIKEPPVYPIPKERSQKSANVVPTVVVAIIVIQYKSG